MSLQTNVEVTETGLNLGGAIGLAIPAVIGAYEALPDSWKPQKSIGGFDGYEFTVPNRNQ